MEIDQGGGRKLIDFHEFIDDMRLGQMSRSQNDGSNVSLMDEEGHVRCGDKSLRGFPLTRHLMNGLGDGLNDGLVRRDDYRFLIRP